MILLFVLLAIVALASGLTPIALLFGILAAAMFVWALLLGVEGAHSSDYGGR